MASRPSVWRSLQMRGFGASYRHFTAHRDDIDLYHSLPFWKKIGMTLERWLERRYGDVIYAGGSYPRGQSAADAAERQRLVESARARHEARRPSGRRATSHR